MKIKLRLFVTALLFIGSAFGANSLISSDNNDDLKPIRIVFHRYPGFCDYGTHGMRNGLCVEWVEKLSAILNWKINWVDARWSETEKLLKEDKIDIAIAMTADDKRNQDLILTHLPIGYWSMSVYALADSALDGDDFRSLDGCVIGVPAAHPLVERLRSYLSQNGLICPIREYEGEELMFKALLTGEVGAIFSQHNARLRKEKLLFTLPSSPVYFAANSLHPQLAVDLDNALAELHDQDADFLDRILGEYFSSDYSGDLIFSAAERSWLGRQIAVNRVFTVDLSPIDGLLKNVDPETGKATQFVSILLEEISKATGLRFSVLSPTDFLSAKARFQDGVVDILMPYGGSLSGADGLTGAHLRRINLDLPQAVLTARFADIDISDPQVRISVASDDRERINVYGNLGYASRLVICNDDLDAARAVISGRADCFIAAYSKLRGLVHQLNAIEMTDIRIYESIPYRPRFPIFVGDHADAMLYSVLAKVCSFLSRDRLVDFQYRAESRKRHDNMTFEVMLPYISIGVLVVALILILMLVYFGRRDRRALARTNASLKLARDAIAESNEIRGQLREALEKAEFAAKSKSNFLATMSHEIRTPLNAVVGYSEFLVDPQLPRDKVAEYARSISLSSNALLSLINDILDLSKFESGRREGLDLRTGECEVQELFSEMDTVFRMRAREKGIAIAFEINQAMPVLKLTEARLRQILLNLIGNAVKFTDKGGIDISAKFEDGQFTLKVSDSGIGISPRGLKFIFDPFSQDMDSRRGKVYAGTGLGLSIVKRLVESSAGEIKVDSIIGKGSTFTVSIPGVEALAPRKKPTSSPARAAIVSPTKIASVIIVDDMVMNREILRLHCQSLGIADIKVFASGQEVLDYLHTGATVDVVLSDMWMPQMDGAQLSTAIAAEWPKLAVVAVTADTDAGSKFDISAFRAILSKPVTSAKLKQLFAKLEQGE